MTKLSVNVNKIALLRNARNGLIPNIVELSKKCIESGANGITVHPRSDMRHIKPGDVKKLRKLTKDYSVEFNIEGNPFSNKEDKYPGFINLVETCLPEQCTLVPDDPNQLTSDHGWDLLRDSNKLKDVIKSLKDFGIRISLFLDPNIDQINKAKELGADRIELYTGPYAEEFSKRIELKRCLSLYKRSLEEALNIGLQVNAGHDLNLKNLKTFLKIGSIKEVSIGHALISDSLIFGIEETVKLYVNECN